LISKINPLINLDKFEVKLEAQIRTFGTLSLLIGPYQIKTPRGDTCLLAIQCDKNKSLILNLRSLIV